MKRILDQRPGRLTSELDEQGLQVATLSATGKLRVVPLHDVTVCSPFAPHVPYLGRCGAHFVGLNARSYGWRYFGRRAEQVREEHWDNLVGEVERRVGLSTEVVQADIRAPR